jgi:hypothetical protein
MNSRNGRLLVIIVFLLLAIATFVVASRYGRKKELPVCAGLSCYEDSDCGSKCSCERAAGSKLGKCIAK